MRLNPIPFAGGYSKDDVRPFDQRDPVNYIPEPPVVPSARSPMLMRGLPGMKLKATLGSGPYRGAHNCEGILFVVSGQSLYQVDNDYTTHSLGTIPGTGRVSIAHNQITNGYEVCIATGTQGFVYNTATAAFTQITSENFPGSLVFDYIDSYILGVEPQGRYFFWSALADALTYSSLDNAEAEGAPDLIVTLVVDHQEVLVLGTRTAQIFVDTGASDGAFQNAQGVFIEQGCAARFSVAKLDNSVFWFANDGKVYRANGYTPVVVSTPSVEQAMQGLDWANAYAYTWTDSGHKVYYLTFPDGPTFGYDVVTGLWHRRASYRMTNWRIATLTFWNGVYVAGDAFDGRLYQLDWNTFVEDDAPLVAEHKGPYQTDGSNRLIVTAFELLFNTGFGATADSTVSMRYSDDNGNTWTNWKDQSLGLKGQYSRRVRWTRLGSTRGRVYHVQVASPVKRDIVAAYGAGESTG